MSENISPLKILSCVLCDDVLETKDGKLVIVGMQGGLINIPSIVDHIHLTVVLEAEVVAEGPAKVELCMFEETGDGLESLEDFIVISDLEYAGEIGAIGHFSHMGVIEINKNEQKFLYRARINNGDWFNLRRVEICIVED